VKIAGGWAIELRKDAIRTPTYEKGLVVNLGLVGMYKRPLDDTFENRLVSWFKSRSLGCLQPIDGATRERKLEKFVDAFCHSILRDLQFDELIEQVRANTNPVLMLSRVQPEGGLALPANKAGV
jgi:hypothetical protein